MYLYNINMKKYIHNSQIIYKNNYKKIYNTNINMKKYVHNPKLINKTIYTN